MPKGAVRQLLISMKIDDIAETIVLSFNEGEKLKLKDATKNMLSEIKIDEGMFSVVRKPYLVAKSLYFMLTQDYLTIEEQTSVIKLVYFCLLNNYLKNCDSKPGDMEYEDLILGCKLTLVLISMQNQYLMYILYSQGYITPEMHIRNQILVFGGVVKNAKIKKYDILPEEVINRYFVGIYEEINSYLPTGEELRALKENSMSVIKNIKTGIAITLYKDDDSSDFNHFNDFDDFDDSNLF